ncbi:cold-shock protein [Mesorhizobium salmacidum]|uniref:Cold shock domain-containing protein n=1 Tax=Mesorhizobium salmacidum TaxID=3015171 RepID=A0ABU8L1W4_9HYPH
MEGHNSTYIRERDNNVVWNSRILYKISKFKALNDAINDYYSNAFAPEIITALQLVENSTSAVEIFAKYAQFGATFKEGDGVEVKSETKKFQTNLLYIQGKLQDALASVKLSKSVSLFIDGIDIRPASIPFNEYLDCVKGLANAAWSLNNDFFPKIRDSKGRMKCVLLLRPDIFNSLGLQNRNTKLKDNSIVLSWITDYGKYRSSELFLMADRMFSVQQDKIEPPGDAWDYYFPFEATNLTEEHSRPTSFVIFLRYSYHRPRDILTMLDILNDHYKSPTDKDRVFLYSDLFTRRFKEDYGQYLLGEIKDSLSFYYDESEFELFLKFFEYLNGKSKFDYDYYELAFAEFYKYVLAEAQNAPGFMKSAEEFLQFLYDQNILCFIEEAEDEKFIRWCFRERTPSNISPKVKTGMEYEIHYGLANTLNTGKQISKPKQKNKSKQDSGVLIGVINMVDKGKKFGFIRQDGMPIDIHFKFSDCEDASLMNKGTSVRYSLKKGDKGGLSAYNVAISR